MIVRRIWLQIVMILMLWAVRADAELIFEETFDTIASAPRQFFSGIPSNFPMQNGMLVMPYSSNQPDHPSGIEYTLPVVTGDPGARVMEMNFIGGGAGGQTSNSLFISYAVGPGVGLSLPALPAGGVPNDRTGYIIRLIRHGDGTNEVKFYRNDGGWAKPLKSDWTLPFNPITALRRAAIKHQKGGEHTITITFDTGTVFERRYSFQDDAYPPNNRQRGLQLAAKGHAAVNTTFHIMTDTWRVSDLYSNEIPSENRAMMKSAQTWDSAADIIEAKKLYKAGEYGPAREICLNILYADTQNADALDLLGPVEMALDNHADAVKYMIQTLNIHKKIYGPDHPKVASALINLARIYGSRDTDKAEGCHRRALAIRERALGPDHPDVAEVLGNLGEFYRMQGRYAKAEPYLNRALKIRERSAGPDSEEVADVLQTLAALYDARGQYSRQAPLLERLISIREKLPMRDADKLAVAQHQQTLAYLYQRTGQPGAWEPLLKRSLETREKILGPDHPDVAKALSNLAVIYQNSGRYSEAEPLYKRAVAIREKALGKEHPFVAGDLHHLALLHVTQGRYAEAEQFLKRALSIFEKSLGPNHKNVRETLEKLAQLYRRMGRPLESDFYADRAGKIREGGGVVTGR